MSQFLASETDLIETGFYGHSALFRFTSLLEYWEDILDQLNDPAVRARLTAAGIDVDQVRDDVESAMPGSLSGLSRISEDLLIQLVLRRMRATIGAASTVFVKDVTLEEGIESAIENVKSVEDRHASGSLELLRSLEVQMYFQDPVIPWYEKMGRLLRLGFFFPLQAMAIGYTLLFPIISVLGANPYVALTELGLTELWTIQHFLLYGLGLSQAINIVSLIHLIRSKGFAAGIQDFVGQYGKAVVYFTGIPMFIFAWSTGQSAAIGTTPLFRTSQAALGNIPMQIVPALGKKERAQWGRRRAEIMTKDHKGRYRSGVQVGVEYLKSSLLGKFGGRMGAGVLYLVFLQMLLLQALLTCRKKEKQWDCSVPRILPPI